MRIYEVKVEHKRYGRNWSSERVEGRTFDEAIKAVKRVLAPQERIESVELLAATD